MFQGHLDGCRLSVPRRGRDLSGGLRAHQSSASGVRVAARERSVALRRMRGIQAVLGGNEACRHHRSGAAAGTVRERTASDHHPRSHQSGNARRTDRADLRTVEGFTEAAAGARERGPRRLDSFAGADGRARSSEVSRTGAAVVQTGQPEAPRRPSRGHHTEHPRHHDGRRRRAHARLRAGRGGVPSAEDDRRAARRSGRGRMAHSQADQRTVRRRRPGDAACRRRSAVDLRNDQGPLRVLRPNDRRAPRTTDRRPRVVHRQRQDRRRVSAVQGTDLVLHHRGYRRPRDDAHGDVRRIARAAAEPRPVRTAAQQAAMR